MTSRAVYFRLRQELTRLYRLTHGGRKAKSPSVHGECQNVSRRPTLMLTIPGLITAQCLWGFGGGEKKKEEEKPQKKEGPTDPITLLIREADQLYGDNRNIDVYDLLITEKDTKNDEILWRLARAAFDKGKSCPPDSPERKSCMFEAFEYSKEALKLNENNFACHKKAISLKPDDATTIHLLGVWCFSVAGVTWYERQFANVAFTTPPSSSYQEALDYFLMAEKKDPNFYTTNLLYIGKCYLKLQDAKEAYHYLMLCKNAPVHNRDDKEAHHEATAILKGLGVKT